jgi:small-conductance mechanosensitive channel
MKKTDAAQDLSPDEIPGPPPDPNSPAERFYGAAITRIVRGILVLGIAGTAVALATFGIRTGVSFLAGAGLAYWNFRSLVSAVNSLGERIVAGHSREKGSAIVFRFISRILLVGIAGYAIFFSWPASLPGFLVGLCMPVPALMVEAGYEGFIALRRGL